LPPRADVESSDEGSFESRAGRFKSSGGSIVSLEVARTLIAGLMAQMVGKVAILLMYSVVAEKEEPDG
jgi:hypothetical protein